MSVVVRRLGGKHMDAYLKGAPEVVASLCKQHTGQTLILRAQGWDGYFPHHTQVDWLWIKNVFRVFNYKLYISIYVPIKQFPHSCKIWYGRVFLFSPTEFHRHPGDLHQAGLQGYCPGTSTAGVQTVLAQSPEPQQVHLHTQTTLPTAYIAAEWEIARLSSEKKKTKQNIQIFPVLLQQSWKAKTSTNIRLWCKKFQTQTVFNTHKSLFWIHILQGEIHNRQSV